MNDTAELLESEKRVAQAAQILGHCKPRTLVDPDGGPSREVLAFCKQTGIILDYIFCGDIYALAPGSANADAKPTGKSRISNPP